MTIIDLKEIEKIKYNPWCSKNVLRYKKEVFTRALPFLTRKDLSPRVKYAYNFHLLTGCNGFEFIAVSNIKFVDNVIILPNNAILVPWFYPEMDSKPIEDPRVHETLQMHENAKFIYDGWIAIDEWDEKNINDIIQSISEALSIFSLMTESFFEWKPKYIDEFEAKSFSELSGKEIEPIFALYQRIRTANENDRRAIYRSISWLNQGRIVDNPSARFLFFILAIESLANYIEKDANRDSCFLHLKTEKRDAEDVKKWRIDCIKEKIPNLENNPSATIESCYFDCVKSIKMTLKKHLETVFSSKSNSIKLLFEEKVNGKTLYDLRHKIAHGSLDSITEEDLKRIIDRLWDAERIANNYILKVLEKSL